MNSIRKLRLLTKEIGIPGLSEYAYYQFEKRTGIVAHSTPSNGKSVNLDQNIIFPFPKVDASFYTANENQDLLKEADSVAAGLYRPFGAEPQPLSFSLHGQSLSHWTKYGDHFNGQDIKWVWEPARFTWAFDLARAWIITRNEKYPQTFWKYFSEFLQQNPVNLGPNWASAQEAALRIIIWSLVYPVFGDSMYSSPENKEKMQYALWHSAARIPPTLVYARSQNNNHLLSEALGLMLAGSIFSNQSSTAQRWLKTGIREFNAGILKQIEADGTYSQHSANYHRLMLQLGLLYYTYAKHNRLSIPDQVLTRFASATRWITDQLDPVSGRLPNLGHNDGALLLPLGCTDFRDYRPTAQAASRAFLGTSLFPSDKWDELSTWLGFNSPEQVKTVSRNASQAVHKLHSNSCWVTLRGVHFTGRPAHADQLHLDLWWDGINLAQDAGTFSYNDAPPWENPFAATQVHNTISIDDQDQMTRISKFLWLEQAQAKWMQVQNPNQLAASHDGYRKKGITHTRSVEFINELEIQILDQIIVRQPEADRLVRIHWLLPDWQWEQTDTSLIFHDADHQVQISTTASGIPDGKPITPEETNIIRAGVTLCGSLQNPILGWVSPTYGVKEPALSFSIRYNTVSSIQIKTNWKLFRLSSLSKE